MALSKNRRTTDFPSERVKNEDQWMTTMKAAVIHEAVDPRFLKMKASLSHAAERRSMIRVKAFGLNRSPSCLRGRAIRPSVKSLACWDRGGWSRRVSARSEFRKGAIVATAMGGMGRQFDGGYAEFTCVPATTGAGR